MRKKILFVASVPLHFRSFHIPYFKWFQENGYEVHTACNDIEELPYVDKSWKVSIERNPYNTRNYQGYKDLKYIIDNHFFELIHCHTPVASFITRIASLRTRKQGTRLLYTAHGFHFYRGASLVNWLLFFPIEILLTRITDGIICLNEEDFQRVKKFGSSKCSYFIIPGIGVAKNKFFPLDSEQKNKLRIAKNFPNNKFIIVYSAEFINRKNHKYILNAIKSRKDDLTDILFLFAGKGEKKQNIEKIINKFALNKHVKLIGFRKDIDEIYQISDLGISTSKQEGLPINLVEEMMCGLPIIATNVRGNADVVQDNYNGFLVDINDNSVLVNKILELKTNDSKYNNFRSNAIKSAKQFELSNSLDKMSEIYKLFLN